MTAPSPVETFITSKDGTRLSTLAWPAAGEAKARLLFLHGWGEHARRYGFPIDWFSPKGYACFAFDVRGHGGSAGKRGYINRFSEYLDDVEAWLSSLPESDLPTYLVGHSQGGLIAARFAQHRAAASSLAGILLSSPFLALNLKVPWWKMLPSKLLTNVAPGLAIPADLEPEDLTKDTAISGAYDQDPMVLKKACVRWFTETLEQQSLVVVEGDRMKHPCLIMHGAADKIANPEVTRAFHEACGSEDKTLRLYEGLRHEIFNEIEREEVFAEMEEWLEARLAG